MAVVVVVFVVVVEEEEEMKLKWTYIGGPGCGARAMAFCKTGNYNRAQDQVWNN